VVIKCETLDIAVYLPIFDLSEVFINPRGLSPYLVSRASPNNRPNLTNAYIRNTKIFAIFSRCLENYLGYEGVVCAGEVAMSSKKVHR
jgi:hypothetical protein